MIGVLLLLNSQRIIDNPVMIFICLMIIELGLKLLFGKKYKKIKNKNCDSYIGIFGESNSLNNDPNFQGCDIVTVFGTVKLDLSEIDFKNDVKIDAVNVFGTIYLTIPDDIEVNISGINIFSSNHNKKKIDNPKHTIFIENVSVFGDIKIK